MRLVIEEIDCHPVELKLHQLSRVIEISFSDGKSFSLPYEYLRVYTPSAEALGHGPGQEVLQVGKEHVTIESVKPVGNYAIAPTFSDGHQSGIYSWSLLYKLGNEYPELWQDYLNRLEQAGYSRQSEQDLR